MPGGRVHTPIVSRAQRGMFGAELGRRREGQRPRMKGISTAELKGHLEESAGKNLPYRSRPRKSASPATGPTVQSPM